jgi:uncharacterized protein YecE (DUF72 family)
MRVVCGTSGYNYDEWKGSFYPEELAKAKRLAYYASQLASVEINYSFYRKPTVKALDSWAAQTPPGFTFALKAWQRITHQARLKEAGELTRAFCETARALGDKLGPILFQLPPNFKKDAPRLEAFLAEIPDGIRAAFEFRHASWFDDQVIALLGARGAVLAAAENEELAAPLARTAPWIYLRLRREDYDDAALDGWAERVRAAGFDEVFAYFKHEDGAKGPRFAARFASRFA